MRIALCTPINRADHLMLRIASVVWDDVLVIDVLDREAVAQAPLTYDGFWVAVDGAEGMEAVIAIKGYAPSIPVVWMSEDKQFAAIAHNLKVASFLTQDCTEEEFAEALREIKNDRRGINANCVVL